MATILPRLDMSNEYMAETVIYTVGALAEWLVDNTGFISSLLPLVIPGLEVILAFIIIDKFCYLET